MSQEVFRLQAQAKPLKGATAALPALNGRGSYWHTIIDQSPCGQFIKIKRPNSRARWVKVRDAQSIHGRNGKAIVP